jgi:hypothetical protein
MPFFQIQVNPQDDDLDAILSRAAPGSEMLSTIYNSLTSVTLNFGRLPKTSVAVATGPLKIATVPKHH